MRECIDNSYLPQSLAIGIPYELFWTLNPRKLIPFQKTEKIRYERDLSTANLISWLSGKYVTEAIASCFGKNHKYPINPYDLFGSKKQELTMKEKLELWAISVNSEFDKKQSEGQ